MYCGDETAAIVGDFGTNSFKFGFAGEDMPKGDIPSVAGIQLSQKTDSVDISSQKTKQISPTTAASITANRTITSTSATKAATAATPTSQSADSRVEPKTVTSDGKDLVETNQSKALPIPQQQQKQQGSGSLGKLALGISAIDARKLDTELVNPMKDGLYDRLDIIEKFWEHSIAHELSSKPEEHPVLICDPSFNTLEIREKLLETMFEKLRSPLLYLAPNAMLSAFSVGRATALVVDVGASGSCVVPVNDGYLLRRSLKRSRVGGNMVDQHLLQLLEETIIKRQLRPQCTFTKKRLQDGTLKIMEQPSSFVSRIHPTYLNWQKQYVVQDMKKSVCRVWSELTFDRTAASAYIEEKYELPDGTLVSMGADRFLSPELMINPSLDLSFSKEFLELKEKEASSIISSSLPSMIRDSVQSAHVDLRKELVQQVLVVGGGSLLPGTIERLGKEIGQDLPTVLKARFLTPSNHQRLYSAWTGGSILSSLGSFQQMWLSKAEYEEYGAKSLLISRCKN